MESTDVLTSNTAIVTTRDYFAAHSPIDVDSANERFYREYGRNASLSEMLETLADLRFRYADSMMAARSLNCDKHQTD